MISFQVSDMTCGHCINAITRAVKASHYTQVRNIRSRVIKEASGWAGQNRNSRRLIWVTRV